MKRFIIALFCAVMACSPAFAQASSGKGACPFELKDGQVYKNGKGLSGYLGEVSPEVAGNIRYWAAMDPDVDESISEAETGLAFFSAGGACVRFIPFEDAPAVRDVIFSPDGGKFAIATGSGIRPDVAFEIYGPGPEKLAEFFGTLGGLAWLDPHRFVLTMVDGALDDEDGAVVGLCTSVVVVETVTNGLEVLKEGTDTKTFWFEEIVDGGKAVTIRELSVKSKKDWADEDKIEEREIRVEVPAAG